MMLIVIGLFVFAIGFIIWSYWGMYQDIKEEGREWRARVRTEVTLALEKHRQFLESEKLGDDTP